MVEDKLVSEAIIMKKGLEDKLCHTILRIIGALN